MEGQKQNKKMSEQGEEPEPQAPIAPTKKLNPADPVDTWRAVFRSADPERYHQFRQNNRPGTKKPQAKIDQMAAAASYAAKEPKK